MGYQITIEPLGQTVEIAEGQTVLDACLRAGVWIPHACCHGLCATCKVQVLDGEFEHGEASPFALMDFERDENKVLACCATPQSDLVIEAEVDEDPDARYLPLQDFLAQVVRTEMLTPTILGLWLQPDRAIAFQAGQYVMLRVPGVQGARAFSIASAPGDALIELHIRKVEGGPATTWLHEQVKVGDRLEISGPFGRFFVRKSATRQAIFLAGGSGLSSPKSMVLDLLAEGAGYPITLFHGARTRQELYFADLFEALATEHANFRYVPVLSANEDATWTGATGYVHQALQQHLGNDFRGSKAYLCGPPPMIEGCIATLMQGRLFEPDIYTEKFFTAAEAGAPARRSPLFKSL